MDRKAFHTAISAVIELVNAATRHIDDPRMYGQLRYAARIAAVLIAPVAPHVAAEIHDQLGAGPVWNAPWPSPAQTPQIAEQVRMVVQVNGKVRATIDMPVGSDEDEIGAAAVSAVARYLDQAAPRRVIVVPGRLVSVVI
jgi:leucyl-tRNA synthetase